MREAGMDRGDVGGECRFEEELHGRRPLVLVNTPPENVREEGGTLDVLYQEGDEGGQVIPTERVGKGGGPVDVRIGRVRILPEENERLTFWY